VIVREGPLPDYHWASASSECVPRAAWDTELTPVTARESDELPPAPPPQPGDLEQIAHRRIRILAAYWHEGWPFSRPTAWLRPGAANALYRAADDLPKEFGLAVWDAWRDPQLQAVLHDTVYQDSTLAPGFVTRPDPDPARCPPHASGGTVDLTLTWRGVPLSLGTSFDAFVPAAAAAAFEPDGPRRDRDLRRRLAAAMGGAGFVVHPQEWWHWEYGTRFWAAVTGEPVRYGHTIPKDG